MSRSAEACISACRIGGPFRPFNADAAESQGSAGQGARGARRARVVAAPAGPEDRDRGEFAAQPGDRPVGTGSGGGGIAPMERSRRSGC